MSLNPSLRCTDSVAAGLNNIAARFLDRLSMTSICPTVDILGDRTAKLLDHIVCELTVEWSVFPSFPDFA